MACFLTAQTITENNNDTRSLEYMSMQFYRKSAWYDVKYFDLKLNC